MQRYLGSFDLVWDTRSGDSFSDIYGLSRLAVMSSIHEYARQAGTSVVMAPQTIGPFRTRRGRWLARRTLRRSELVFARDARSAEASAALGRPVDATVTDLVFGVDQPAGDTSRDILLNVSGLLWNENSHVDHEAYRADIRSIIRALLADGRRIALLPHVLDSGDRDNDVPTSLQLHEEFEGAVELVVPRDLEHARSIISSAGLMIGARMHACLNALSTGVPAIAMAYSRKFEPLLDAIGWDEVVAIVPGGQTATSVVDAVARPGLSERALASRTRAQDLLALALPLLARVD
jgi:polysaccharide pyruvyl transferase WcaK-like protein